MSVYAKVKYLCDLRGISINHLETNTDIGRGNIARWDKHAPAVDKVVRVARYFNVSTDYLLETTIKDPFSERFRERIGEYLNIADSADKEAASQGDFSPEEMSEKVQETYPLSLAEACTMAIQMGYTMNELLGEDEDDYVSSTLGSLPNGQLPKIGKKILNGKDKKFANTPLDYDALTLEHKKTVEYLISALLAKQREEEKPVEDVRYINLFELPASAGSGTELTGFDRRPIEILNTPEAARADYALIVRGDSMEPKFSDGDIVLVEAMPEVPNRAIGVFVHDGESYIKQRDGAYMRSFNPAYKPILTDSETLTQGRVLGKAELV